MKIPLSIFGLIVLITISKKLMTWNPRKQVVKAALSQIGLGNANKYWEDVIGSGPYPKEWCGGFALWALHQAGLAKNWKWEIGKGFLYKLPVTQTPEIGDIAYFEKNQHQAVIKMIHDDGTMSIINGNGVGGVVNESRGPLNNAKAFYSIQPLIT